MENIELGYFYIVKDEYMQKFEKIDTEIMWNKDENRPFYYAAKVDNYLDIYWLIPVSSKIDKYKAIIEKKESENKDIDILHISKIGKKETVFLINKMIPVPLESIERCYKINDVPFKLVSKKDMTSISEKVRKIIALTEENKYIPFQPDVLNMLKEIEINRSVVKEMGVE